MFAPARRHKESTPYVELLRMVHEAKIRSWRQELRSDLSSACIDLLDRWAALLHG